jgi:hypothetical protein
MDSHEPGLFTRIMAAIVKPRKTSNEIRRWDEGTRVGRRSAVVSERGTDPAMRLGFIYFDFAAESRVTL